MMHFLWFFILSSDFIYAGAEVTLERIWLDQNSALKVPLHSENVNVFCFERPSLYQWFSSCLKDVVVNMQLSSIPHSWNSGSYQVAVYEGFLFRESGSGITCSSLDSLSSDTSPFDMLSFLLNYSPITAKKTLFTTNGFNWSVPSYSPSCIAVCATLASRKDAPSLSISVTPVLNVRHVFFAVVGIIFLLASNLLSSNITFYYFSGSGFVVLGSFLLVLLMFVRVLPFRRGGAIVQTAIVLLGGTFSLILVALDYVRASVLQFLADNIELTLIYTISVTILSLLFFYWLHIPERLVINYPRTKTIMKYFLQVVGASLIVCSVHLPFSDEELLLSLLDILPSSMHFDSSPSANLTQSLKRLLPKFSWVLMSAIIVILVNLMDLLCSCLCGKTRKNAPYFSMNSRFDFADHVPGSPWASSSPYGAPLDAKNRLSMMDLNSPRSTLPKSPARLDFSNGLSFSKRPISYPTKYTDDLLTDDESD